MGYYLYNWMLVAELTFEVHLRLQSERAVRTLKQEKNLMIYVLSFPLLNCADDDLDGNYAGKPWSEMPFHSSLFSVMQHGYKIC
jgi:hypothetical protein